MSVGESVRSRRRRAAVVGASGVTAVGFGAVAVAQPLAILAVIAVPLVVLVPAVSVAFATMADGVALPLIIAGKAWTTVNIVVLVAAIVAALVAVLRGRVDRRVGWPVAAMAALVLPATLLAVAEFPTDQWLSGFRYVFVPLLVALLASTMSARSVRMVLRGLTVLVAINAIASGIESALGSDRLLALTHLSYGRNIRNIGTTLRAMGTFATNYQLGAFAGVLTAAALLWWGTLPGARQDRVWRIVAVVSGVACLVFSTYRTGIIVLVVAIAAAVFLTRGVVAAWVRLTAAIGGLIAVVGFLAAGLGSTASLFERFSVWGQLLAVSPRFFGRGLGAAGAASQAVGSKISVFTDNYYISMWLQFGVGGVLAIVLFLAVAVGLFRAGRRGNTRAALAVTIWIGVLVGFFFVELWEYTSAMSIVALVLAASVSRAGRPDPDQVVATPSARKPAVHEIFLARPARVTPVAARLLTEAALSHSTSPTTRARARSRAAARGTVTPAAPTGGGSEPPRGAGRSVRTFGWFVATVVVTGASSIITIPVIVTLTSAHAWAAVALGQAVGSSLSVLTMFGWGITGPARIAMMPRSGHRVAYWDSVVARLIVLLPVVAITIGVTWVIAPSDRVAAIVAGIAMAAGGLSGTWALIGRREPVAMFWADTVPRVAGTVLGVVVLSLGGGLIAFSVLQLVGALAAFVIVSIRLLGGVRRPEGGIHDARGAWRVIREQRHGVAVAVAIAAYYPLVLVIVARFIPAQLPLYALNEKLLRFATMAMQPVHQYMQAAVPSQRGPALARALRWSLGAIIALSLLAWALYTVLLPVASGLLTDGQVAVPTVAAILLGAFMGFSVLESYMTSVALVAVDRVGVISRVSLIGFGVGLVAVLLAAFVGAADALAAGFVVSGIVTVAYQTVVFLRAMPRHPVPATEEPTEPALNPTGSVAVGPIMIPEA